MKNICTLSFLLLFTSNALFSQAANTLSGVADLLFKNVKTKLFVTEKNHIAAKLGFILSGNKEQPFAQDKDSKEFPFTATALPTDMNKDGQKEIFVGFGNTYTSGNTGSSITLFIKNSAGAYSVNLGFPGMVPDALATVSMDYPDLLIGGPGFEFPVWRWNGKTYAFYKTVKDKDYGKLKKTSVKN